MGISGIAYDKFSHYYSAFSGELRAIKLRPGQKVTLGGVIAAADNSGMARLDTSFLRQPYTGSLVVQSGHADSVLAKEDFVGRELYSYGPINWIEQSKYKNVADRGETIVGEWPRSGATLRRLRLPILCPRQ